MRSYSFDRISFPKQLFSVVFVVPDVYGVGVIDLLSVGGGFVSFFAADALQKSID